MDERSNQLTQVAIQISNDFQRRRLELEKQKLILNLDMMQVEASLVVTNEAIERLKGFRATLGGERQCPQCWIAQGVNEPLIPQPSDTDIDLFKCRRCYLEFSL